MCDFCFRTTNGKLTELKNYCQNNPKAELFQIARALSISLTEVISLINYNNSINSNSNFSSNVVVNGLNTARKIYNEEKEQERLRTERDSNSKLVEDLKRFYKNK